MLLTELNGSEDVCVSMSAHMYESVFWRMNESCRMTHSIDSRRCQSWIRLRASAAIELGEQYSHS